MMDAGVRDQGGWGQRGSAQTILRHAVERGRENKRCLRWAISLFALSLVGVRRSTAAAGEVDVGECRNHDQCSATQFCSESVCSVYGFDELPCTRCEDCLACTPFVSVDRSCPARCPVPKGQVQYLQGIFTQVDEDGCMSMWLFELDNFRRYQTGVQYAAAISYSATGNGRCDRTRNMTQIVTGHFKLTGPSLALWIPLDSNMDAYEKLSASISLIPGGVRITWSGGGFDDLVQYTPVLGGTGAQGGAAGALPAGHLIGNFSMFDTKCNMLLHVFEVMDDESALFEAGVDGGKLYLWRAVTWDCAIGPKKFPGSELELDSADGGLRRERESDGAATPAHLVHSGTREGARRRSYQERSIDLDLGPGFEPSHPAPNPNTNCPGGCANNSKCWMARNKLMTNHTIEKCLCDENYHRVDRQDAYGRKECEDDNECLDGSHNCHQYADCENVNGSFTCTCQAGFLDSGDGVECRDVDECLQGACPGCNRYCANTVGSFECGCIDGFAYKGVLGEHWIEADCAKVKYGRQRVDRELMSALGQSREPDPSVLSGLRFGSIRPGDFVRLQPGDLRPEDFHTGDVCLIPVTGCVSQSEMVIEHGWYYGRRIALTFSWKMKSPKHPQDIIMVGKEDADGNSRQLFWMFISAATAGCSSHMQVAVGYERVMDCHVPTNDYVARGSFSVHQESAGWGTYYARMYSHYQSQIVAEYKFATTSSSMPDLAADTGFEMNGGAILCPDGRCRRQPSARLIKDRCSATISSPDHAPCPYSPPRLGPFCIEIPTFAGYVEKEMPLRCGDGRVASPDEQCDDGNSENSDGCDASCMIEGNSTCFYTFNPVFRHDPGSGMYSVSPPDSKCVVFRCGDGQRNRVEEQCDDGNDNERDGCHRNCMQAAGYSCARNLTSQKVPGSERLNFLTDDYDWDYAMVDMGEVCTPFIVPLRENGIDPPGCPDCHENGECVLFEYSKQCMCSNGFVSDKLNYLNILRNLAFLYDHEHICADLDECEREREILEAAKAGNRSTEMIRRLCPSSARCVNTFGSFECVCGEGLTRVSTADGTFKCVDINECFGFMNPCAQPETGGFCKNTLGSFECGCRTGFRGTGIYQDGPCEQIDECAENSHACAPSQICVDAKGSFMCFCPGDSPIFFESECFSDTFLQDNTALFQDWGRKQISNAVQGLVRFWHVPETNMSSTGVARWWVFKSQSHPRVYNSAYFVHNARNNSSQVTYQSNTSSGNNVRPLEMAIHCPAEKVFTVSDVEGIIRINSSKELGSNLFTWAFSPFERSLEGRVMYIGFLTYNLIRMPENPLEEDRLSFCGGVGSYVSEESCRTFNASHPPRNPFAIKLPFTIRLLTADMHPETTAWKLFSLLRPEKCAFNYGLRAPAGLPNLTAIESVSPRNVLLGSKNVLIESSFGRGLEFSIKNKADGRVVPPCGVKRKGLVDDFSVFHVTTVSAESSILDGIWKGSCDPRVGLPVSGEGCRVTFSLVRSIFELQISGCPGWDIPTFATGKLTQEDGNTSKLINALSGAYLGTYRNFKLHYALGIPARSTPGYKVASASYKWLNGEIEIPDTIVMNINAPAEGTMWHPGDIAQTSDEQFEKQEYPCQVLKLHRMFEEDIHEASLLRTLPDPSRLVEIEQNYQLFQFYSECKRKMQDLDTVLDGYPHCREKLAPLLSANISILSQPFLFSDICNIPCYPYIVEAMKQSHAVCADSWKMFSSRSISSPSNDLIRGRFLAIIVHVAEFLFRSSLACTGNFYRRRCHDVLVFLRSKTTSSCTDRCSGTPCNTNSCHGLKIRLEQFDKSIEVSAVQFLQFDAFKGGVCDLSCRADLETFLAHGSCCLASIEEARMAWLETVLPSSSNQMVFAASEYLSTYGSGKQSWKSDPKPVIIRRPHGTCPSSSERSLDCAFKTCFLDRLWPESCCPAMDCQNGFESDYLGTCSCRCTPPFAGVYCQHRKSQVVFAVRLKETSYVSLGIKAFMAQIADGLNLNGGLENMELSYIDLFEVASERRSISTSETLDIGMRILVDSKKEQGRLVALLKRSMELRTLPASIVTLGFGKLQDAFLVQPYAVSAGGEQVICDECEAKNGTIVQEPRTGTYFNASLIVGIAAALGSILICIVLASYRYYRGGDCLDFLRMSLQWAKSQAIASQERKRRIKELEYHRGVARDKQGWMTLKPGEFVKKSVETTNESGPRTGKVSVDLSKSIVNVSRSFQSPRASVGDSKSTQREFVSSASSRRPDDSGPSYVKVMSDAPWLPLDPERSELDAEPTASKARIDSETAGLKSPSSPRSNASLVASFGVGNEDDSRIDTLVLRQQRLSRKLQELKSGKTAKKLYDRSSQGTPRASSIVDSAPSVWSPPDASRSGHRELELHSSVLLSTIPHIRRIDHGKELGDSENGLRAPAGLENLRQKVWSPRKASPRIPLNLVTEDSADRDPAKSTRSSYTPSLRSASTHSERHVLEFSALEPPGSRIRGRERDRGPCHDEPSQSLKSSMLYLGGAATPRSVSGAATPPSVAYSVASNYEALGSSARTFEGEATPRRQRSLVLERAWTSSRPRDIKIVDVSRHQNC